MGKRVEGIFGMPCEEGLPEIVRVRCQIGLESMSLAM